MTNDFSSELERIDGDFEKVRSDHTADIQSVRADIKTRLADMDEDSEHRTVTDEEKKSWNEKPDEMDIRNATNVFNVTTNSSYSYNVQFSNYFRLNNSPIITFNIPKDKPIQGPFGPDVSGFGFLIRVYYTNPQNVVCFAMVQTNESITYPKNRMYLVIVSADDDQNVWMPMDLDLLYQSIDMTSSGGSEKEGIVSVINSLSNKVNRMKEQVILTQAEYDALPANEQNDDDKIYFIREA